MNISEAARRLGVGRTSIHKGIRSGRLSESVTRDAKGRVDIDPVLGPLEWAGSAGRLSDFEATLEGATKTFAEGLAQWLAVLTVEAHEGAAQVVRAAAEALRPRLGRAPTEAELTEALFARDLWPWWTEALAGSALAKADGIPAADRAEMKRLTGIAAVEEPPAAASEEVAGG